MAAILEYTITNTGANHVVDGSILSNGTIVNITASAGVVLAGDWHLEFNPTPPTGASIYFNLNIDSSLDLNGNLFTIETSEFSQTLVSNASVIRGVVTYDGSAPIGQFFWGSIGATGSSFIETSQIINEAVTLAKIEDLTRGSIIRGNSSNRPAAYALGTSAQILQSDGTDLIWNSVSGDVTINSSGVTAIGAGVIDNADINASAAIARTKIANGTASQVIVNDGSGTLSSEATLAAVRGGTALDSSASSGIPSVSSGTWSIGARTEVLVTDVSFEAAGGTVPSVGDFKILIPFDCTVTGLYAIATKAIAATDNGTIVPKNNAGTTMTSGTITFTASDTRGTAYTSTPSANNVFTAGDILTLTTAKTTAGGWAKVSITYTRLS